MMLPDIYLIDDDYMVNFLNNEIIKEVYPEKSIGIFENAADAIASFHYFEKVPAFKMPRIIFLDINMPVMNGWDFLDQFSTLPKEATHDTGVIMLSSSIDPRDIEKSKHYDCVADFISKPLSIEDLQNMLQ